MAIERERVGQERASLAIASASFGLLKPIGDHFATLPITEALTWSRYAASATDFTSGYLVIFRSKFKESADPDLLKKLDDNAHEEAKKQKGFIGYFKGPLNKTTRENLSCCLWESAEDAKEASLQTAHLSATRVVKEMYERYQLDRFNLTMRKTENGPWILFEETGSKPQQPAH